jgi:hypothetical protein
MEEAGVVESTTSAFSSPVFLLKKPAPPNAPKDYKPQFWAVCDMSRVNLQMQPIFFRLPTAEQAIHKIGHARAQYFNVLDNRNAYYGLPLRRGHVTSQPSRRQGYIFVSKDYVSG